MALSPSHSRISLANPTKPIEDALKDFESILSVSQRQELHKKTDLPDADAVLVFTAKLDARNLERRGRSIASNLITVLQSVRDFSNVIGTFVSAHPEIAALVWGSIQLTTLVLTNFLSYYETASKLFIEFGRLCPIFTDYQRLFPTATKLRAALCGFHAAIIRFCKHLVVASRRPWAKHALQSLLSSFEQEFESDKKDIRAHSENVKNEIAFAKAQADCEDQRQNTISRSRLSRLARKANIGLREINDQQLQGDTRRACERRQKLLDKLSTHRYLTPFTQSRRKTCAGTTEWAFKTAEYATWLDGTGPPLLWCSGKIGSGKTILSASVIDHLLTHKNNDIHIVFYFARFDDQMSLLAKTAVRSILRQLLVPDDLSGDEEDKLKRALSASTTDIADFLCARIKSLKGCYIVIDGIDEFEKQERNELFDILFNIVSQTSNTKLFLSGRESFTQEVGTKFPSLQHISMTNSSVSSGMDLYIDSLLKEKLDKKELVVGSQDLVADIKNALMKGGDGMFLWVTFQVDEICTQHCDEDIRSTINSLPKDLTDVFNRVLYRIVSHNNAKIAQKAFRWIGGMQRPPNLNELREILLVEIGQKYSNPGRICNDIHRIASWCENLVVVDEEHELVQFGHHSIREFLSQKSTKENLQDFHFDLEEAIHYIGEICVTYLNFNDFKTTLARRPKPLPPITPADITGKVFGRSVAKALNMRAKSKSISVDITDSLSSFARSGAASDSDRLSHSHPFLAYAKKYWALHTARFEEDRTETWPQWERMILEGHPLADNPWGGMPFATNDTTVLKWAASQCHLALLRLIMKVREFSRIKQETLQRLGVDLDDEAKRDKILDMRAYHDSWTIPVLTAAVESRNKSIVDELLAAGVSPLDQSPSTSLPIFIELGYADIVGNLLEAGANVNMTVDDDYSTLQFAAKYGHADVIQKLLAAGADLDAASSIGTALVVAAENGHANVIEKLFAAGADLEVDGKYGIALVVAAKNGHADVIQKLLAAGADLDAASSIGTALVVAAENGHANVIEKLFAAGADLNAAGEYSTAWVVAAKNGHTDVIDKLLAAGADVNAAASLRGTALQVAAWYGKADDIDKLLAAGADVNAAAGPHGTALQAAASVDNANVIDELLAAGADVNAAGGPNGTALQTAAWYNKADILDKLLAAGADVNAVGGPNGTALQAALRFDSKNIAKKLRAAGAKK